MGSNPTKHLDELDTEENSVQSADRTLLGFILMFILWIVIFGLAYSLFVLQCTAALNALILFTVKASGAVASLFSSNVSIIGRDIICDGFPVTIISECTGLLEMVILSAAIMAYLSSVRAKLIGLILGNIAIYILNIVRVAVLVLVGAHSRPAFDFMHLYFWQGTLIIMVTLIWLAWLYLVVFREEKRALAVSD